MSGVRDTVEKVPTLRHGLIQQVRYEGPTASIGRRLISAESPRKVNSFVLSKMIVTPSSAGKNNESTEARRQQNHIIEVEPTVNKNTARLLVQALRMRKSPAGVRGLPCSCMLSSDQYMAFQPNVFTTGLQKHNSSL